MIPTRQRFEDLKFHIEGTVVSSDQAAVNLIGLTGSIPEKTYMACWNGHEFEIIECHVQWYPVYTTIAISARRSDLLPFEYSMIAHYPIDPRMLAEDIKGATVAYPNGDNTAWLFAHNTKLSLIHI